MLFAVLRQGLPLALGMASHALFNLVDLALVGRLGPEAVAGVHCATTINFLPMIVGNGLSVATLALMARRLGAGDEQGARALSSRALLWMLVGGLLLGGIGAALVVPSIDAQGAVGEARAIGIEYLLINQLGTFTMFLLMQTTATMRALGEAAMPFALLVGSNVLNLLLDWLLIWGWPELGVPALGAAGAAYATVLSRLLGGAIGWWWIGRRGYRLRWSWVSWRGVPGQRRELLRLGLPQSVQMLVRALALIVLTRVAADLGGVDALAALGATTRLDTLVLFSAVGFASAATTLVGVNYGGGRVLAARAACWWAGLAAFGFAAVTVAAFAWWARSLTGLLVSDASERVLTIGAGYLGVAALGHPFACFCLAVTGGVQGAGRALVPMVLDLAGYLGLLLPAMVAAAAWTESLVGLWWTFVVVNAVIALAYLVYLRRSVWAVRFGIAPP